MGSLDQADHRTVGAKLDLKSQITIFFAIFIDIP